MFKTFHFVLRTTFNQSSPLKKPHWNCMLNHQLIMFDTLSKKKSQYSLNKNFVLIQYGNTVSQYWPFYRQIRQKYWRRNRAGWIQQCYHSPLYSKRIKSRWTNRIYTTAVNEQHFCTRLRYGHRHVDFVTDFPYNDYSRLFYKHGGKIITTYCS